MKRTRLAAILLAVLLIALIPASAAFADAGDYSGGSDFGGSDYGGSSYSYSDDGYSYSRSSSSESSPGEVAAGFIILAVILILILVGRKKNGGASATRSVSGGGGTAVNRSTLSPIGAYQNLDPAFNIPAMEAKIANLYIQMQQCWQNRDISSLRPYMSNMIFEQWDRQLQSHRAAKRTNYVKNPTVLGLTLLGYRQEGGMDILYAEIRARIIDYTLDDNSGQLLSGSMTAEKFMTYEWELVRPSGQQTRAPGAMTTISCPHCGAPVNINQSAKCEYCGSVLTLANNDFVVNRVSAISQQTR